jgi:hypothetical protein
VVVCLVCNMSYAFGCAFICDSYANCFFLLFHSALVQIIINSIIKAKKLHIRMEALIFSNVFFCLLFSKYLDINTDLCADRSKHREN